MKPANLIALLILAASLLPAAGAQAFLQSAVPAQPSPAILASWTDSQAPLACPCQTVNLPLQFQNSIGQNVQVAAGLFTADPSLTGAISPITQVPANSAGSAVLSLSVSCDAPVGPKLFSVQLTPTANDGTPLAQQDLAATVSVVACSKLTLAATQVSRLCPLNSLDYGFIVSNDGVYNQTGTLWVTGLKPSAFTLNPTTFNLQSGQSQLVTVQFTPPVNYEPSPTDTMTLNAQGTGPAQSVTVPLASAYCPPAPTPMQPSNSSAASTVVVYAPKGKPGAGTAITSLATGVTNAVTFSTGFFTYFRPTLTSTALLILVAIILVLAFSTGRSRQQEQTSAKTNAQSLDKVRRIALAVQS